MISDKRAIVQSAVVLYAVVFRVVTEQIQDCSLFKGHSSHGDRPGVCQVPEGIGEQEKMEENGCEIICGAHTTLAVKGQMR